MTRTEAWMLVIAGAGLVLCAQSLYHAVLDVAEAVDEIATRADAPTIPGKIYHSAASTDARRPSPPDGMTGGGRHAAD